MTDHSRSTQARKKRPHVPGATGNKPQKDSPFVFHVAGLLGTTVAPVERTITAPVPHRIGGEMIALNQGDDVTIDARLVGLGESVLVEATISGVFTGECSRCLAPISSEQSFAINEVFVSDEQVINNVGGHSEQDIEEDDEAAVSYIVNDDVDIEQVVIDSVVMALPFSPVCADYGQVCVSDSNDSDMPAPDGVEGEENAITDIRWAGLEKFL